MYSDLLLILDPTAKRIRVTRRKVETP